MLGHLLLVLFNSHFQNKSFLVPDLCTTEKFIFTHYHFKNVKAYLYYSLGDYWSNLDCYLGKKTPSFQKEMRGQVWKRLKRWEGSKVCRIEITIKQKIYPVLPISLISISFPDHIFYLIIWVTGAYLFSFAHLTLTSVSFYIVSSLCCFLISIQYLLIQSFKSN